MTHTASRKLEIIAALLLVCPACTEERTSPPRAAAATASIAAIAAPSSSVSASPAPRASIEPASRLSPAEEARFDAAVRGAIERGEVPGAVLVVFRNHEIVLRKAYGKRAEEPAEALMSVDTMFDLASLTKPMATASCILVLVDRKVLRLRDPVQKWLPAFRGENKETVTLEQLLTHTSGLPAGSAKADHAKDKARALQHVLETPLEKPPGEAYLYSDLGYVLLAQIIEKASGEPLDVFAKKNIFDPLGMRDTMFRPDQARMPRIAPTTIVGEVHDPLARNLEGVAGHAGLFSTADDIARFVSMLMSRGEFEGKPVLSAALTRAMVDLRPVGTGPDKRSLGLGSLFEASGHTGFTGTAFWLDATRGNAVILLTSVLHPDGKGTAKPLRRDVATAANSMVAPR